MSLRPRIPVVMYHSVGKPAADWIWRDMTCPYPLFARQLDRLVKSGYEPASLDDVYESQLSGTLPRIRRVALTFDDGYLDNWVYVYPLLKRAGWRGLIYVNPEFIEPGETPRPNLEDVWAGRCSEAELPSRGFLNWAELEAMDRSGILVAGNHSMSHTWYPTGPEIIDFHRPDLSTPWLAWNARPDRKPFYLTEDQTRYVPFGTPIQVNGRSLGVRRYFPDPAQGTATAAHVAAHGGEAYFARPEWRRELLAVARDADEGKGRFESDEEMVGRFRWEIEEARRRLAARLGRDIPHFCWPGGAYDDVSWSLGEQAGFRTLTVKRSDPVRGHDPAANLIRRISSHHRYSLGGRQRTAHDPELLVRACDLELGRRGARLALRVRKGLNAAGLVGRAG